MFNHLKKLGPGLLVTAAFIGPGTVTTASKAGASFGFTLVWTLVFSTLAAIVLQEMSARLGLVTRQGLGEAVRGTFGNPLLRMLACFLIVAAIAFGNAAYQTGNITGAVIGLEELTNWRPALTLLAASDPAESLQLRIWPLLLGGAAGLLLASGAHQLIERVLVFLVVLMGVVFTVTAVMVRPEIVEILKGAFVPTVPDGALLTVIGLIGTTVVPYNLFLHASWVQNKWPKSQNMEESLGEMRLDNALSIGLGGLVTLAIMSTAAAAFFSTGKGIESAAQMAEQLEPLLGSAAKWFFAIGLCAAGLTSSITAPLAAAYATAGALGWTVELKSWKFRTVWLIVLIAGTLLAALLGKSPTQTILIAQVANGLLLPLVAVFLLIAANRPSVMGKFSNGWFANLIGVGVVVIAAGLGIYKVLAQFGLF